MDLNEQKEKLTRELDKSIKVLRENGDNLALAEKDYKITLSQEALRLKHENMPVTLIDKVIYGIPIVAEKRFKRDIAQAMYTANQEHINSTKLQLRLIENQIKREYGGDLPD